MDSTALVGAEAAEAEAAEARSATKRLKRAVVLIVATAFFVFTALGTVIIPILPHVMTRRLGLPDLCVFPLFAAGPFVQLLLAPPLGKLVDKHGPFKPLLLAFSVLAACAGLFGGALAFVPDEPHDDAAPFPSRWAIYACLFVSRSLQGLSSATIISGGIALVASTHPDEERGGASGTAMSGLALGALSPLVGGYFAKAAGLGAPFYLLGGLVVVDALILSALRPILPPGSIKRAADAAASPPPSAAAAASPARALWRDPSALLVAAAIATGNLASSLTEPLAPLWLGNGPLGYDSGLQGLIFGAATVSYFIMTPIAGGCADKPARRVPQLMVGLCVNACGLCCLGLAPWAATLADPNDRTQERGAAAGGGRGRGGCVGAAVEEEAVSSEVAVHSVPLIIAGLALIGFGLALIDTPSLPLLSAMAEGYGEAGFGEAGAIETTAFAVGQTLGPLLSLPLVAAFDASARTPRWLSDGLAPSAFPAALIHLALVPALLLVKAPRHAEEFTATPLPAGSINSPTRVLEDA
ncbi:hypothetical protein AB1Y20_021781 [Prymnesium parvum]|uniref:Major facilitator superfamily (MFS) profile domain-containing protein n=1 Tax=Prymnesium parvum TaxID=97485 RepID=A0AB34JJP7_PRYPA